VDSTDGTLSEFRAVTITLGQVLLAGLNGVSIDLRPASYQFPTLEHGEWHDLNWLVIAGHVESPDGSWRFRDPCLLTTEAAQLGEWLRQVAEGAVPANERDEQGEVHPAFWTVEPNVGFGLEACTADQRALRVHFPLESAPPWSGNETRVCTHQFYVRCVVDKEALLAAANAWLLELSVFPERGRRDS